MIRLCSFLLHSLLFIHQTESVVPRRSPRGAKIEQPNQEGPRLLQQVMNSNTKNNAPTESPVPSPSPTATPTFSPRPSTSPAPTTSYPTTAMPSDLPTAPTAFPSTSDPTVSPSTSPSETVILGLLNISFSLLVDEVMLSLVSNVSTAITTYLCDGTDFILLSYSGTNSCVSIRRELNHESNGNVVEANGMEEASIIRDPLQLLWSDKSKGGFNYTEWTMIYPVSQIGGKYRNMSDEYALYAMQSLGQAALVNRIEDGDFDRRIGHGARSAVVGHEIETWTEEPETDSGYYQPLQPAALHSLRVAGIILFLIALLTTCFITSLAKKRRIEREWDAEFRERGKGGLVTEEGVNYMLAAVRTISTSPHPNADPTEDNRRGEDNLGFTEAIDAVHSDSDDPAIPAYMNVEMCFTESGEIREGDDSDCNSENLVEQRKALVPA